MVVPGQLPGFGIGKRNPTWPDFKLAAELPGHRRRAPERRPLKVQASPERRRHHHPAPAAMRWPRRRPAPPAAMPRRPHPPPTAVPTPGGGSDARRRRATAAAGPEGQAGGPGQRVCSGTWTNGAAADPIPSRPTSPSSRSAPKPPRPPIAGRPRGSILAEFYLANGYSAEAARADRSDAGPP